MPIPTETKQTSGPRGLADVKVYAKSISITFDDEGDVRKFPREDTDAVPEYVKKSGYMNVSLSREGDKIWTMYPAKGTYKVKFAGFPHRDGEEPQPKDKPGGVRKGRNGGTYHQEPYRQITFLLEITDGSYKGMTIPFFVRYLFEQFESTGLSKISGYGKARSQLEEMLQLCGLNFLEDNIPYSDNVLPHLQDMLLERNTRFMVKMDGGWVSEVMEVPEGL